MADIMNLSAESGRNIIGDDTSPTLTLENTSSGNSLKTQVLTGTGIPLVSSSGVTTVPAASFEHTVLSSPTIATITLTQSTASGAFFEFKGFLASIASASSLQRGIRVKFGDSYGWIPVYVGGVYT